MPTDMETWVCADGKCDWTLVLLKDKPKERPTAVGHPCPARMNKYHAMKREGR